MKKERELSPAEKSLLDLRQKLELAEKANTDKPTTATKTALDAAKKSVSDASAVVNRERFVRVAGGRVNKARTAIKNLANVAAPRSYTYDESDVVKAEKALTDAVVSTIAKMRSALVKGASASKAADDFSF